MKNLVAILFVFSLTFVGNTLNAATQTDPNPVVKVQAQEANSIFVHISAIVVKKTPNGPELKITAIKAGDPKTPLAKNQFAGKMTLKANKIGLQLGKKGRRASSITMPNGLEISAALAEKLGATQSVVMSGGSTMVKQESKSMLWFEIQ